MALAFARTIRVFLLVAGPRIAHGLRVLLGDDRAFEIVGESEDALTPLLPELLPDLILLDGDAYSVESAIVICKRRSPASRVCVLSTSSRAEQMQLALASHADAYIVKDFTPATLPAILHSVVAGGHYVDPRIAGSILRKRVGKQATPGELSLRESEIVRLIAVGLSNRDIGSRLSLSEKTVKNHISHIFAKLKISARSHAAVYAIRTGLVT